jgi:hypothetical protein
MLHDSVRVEVLRLHVHVDALLRSVRRDAPAALRLSSLLAGVSAALAQSIAILREVDPRSAALRELCRLDRANARLVLRL